MLFARLIFESFSFAGNSLRSSKLRTFLSVLGITIGIFAIISVFTGTAVVNFVSEMTLTLSLENVVLGLFVSATIGLLAGFLPALTAARLDPVVAMNTV